jgi:hypothetical protein
MSPTGIAVLVDDAAEDAGALDPAAVEVVDRGRLLNHVR